MKHACAVCTKERFITCCTYTRKIHIHMLYLHGKGTYACAACHMSSACTRAVSTQERYIYMYYIYMKEPMRVLVYTYERYIWKETEVK